MITVSKLGLRAPINWDSDAREHLFLMNKLWNTLVAIEHENYEKWSQVFCIDGEYDTLRQAFETASAKIDELWKERLALRARTRAKASEQDTDYGNQIKEAKTLASDLWKKVKARRSSIKDNPEIVEKLKDLEADRRERVKEARNASGLWWPNYNAVVASYDVARSKAMATGTRLKFHAFTGEGRFTVQFQKPITVSELFSGKNSSAKIEEISPEAFAHLFGKDKPPHDKFKLLHVTIYTFTDENGKRQRRNLMLPIFMSRDLPANAIIKSMQVTCRKRDSVPLPGSNTTSELIKRTTKPFIADAYEWYACFTLQTPDVESIHKSKSACGLNFGWRQTSHGIRVATLVDISGNHEHFYLPNTVIQRLARADSIKSELDDAANIMRSKISEWLKELDDRAPEEWMEAAKDAVNSRSHDKLYQLVLLWNTWSFHQFMPNWKREMDDWHSVKCPKKGEPDYDLKNSLFWTCDFRKRREMIGLREGAQNHRLTWYQTIAKQIATKYALIGIGQLELKKSALTEQQEEVLPEVARSNRVKASLFELTDWLKKQAAKCSSEIVKAKRPVTNTCHKCGAKQNVPADALAHTCTKCHSVWDRDVNAAMIALQDAIQAEEKVV